MACLPRVTRDNKSDISITEKRLMPIKEMLKNSKFWHLCSLLFFGCIINAYILNMYKIIGMIHIDDDHFLSYIGSALFFCGSIGRISYGILMDKYSWRIINTSSYLAQTIIVFAISFVLAYKVIYGILVAILGLICSNIYIGILVLSARLFPQDKWIISYITLTFILIFFTPYLIEEFISPEIGYNNTFYLITSCGVISTVLSYCAPMPERSKSISEPFLGQIEEN